MCFVYLQKLVLEDTFTPLNLFAFDSVWVLANALDRLLGSVEGLLDVENDSVADGLSLQNMSSVNGTTVRKKFLFTTL